MRVTILREHHTLEIPTKNLRSCFVADGTLKLSEQECRAPRGHQKLVHALCVPKLVRYRARAMHEYIESLDKPVRPECVKEEPQQEIGWLRTLKILPSMEKGLLFGSRTMIAHERRHSNIS